jgi:hypothetical protein
VELDAIPPNTLRQMVRSVIERHIDPVTLQRVRTIETQEKARFAELARESGTSTTFDWTIGGDDWNT